VYIAKAQSELKAGLSRLTHLQLRRADPVNVPDTKVGFRHTVNREILAESAWRQQVGMLWIVAPPRSVMS
jgi:hypothetical protein